MKLEYLNNKNCTYLNQVFCNVFWIKYILKLITVQNFKIFWQLFRHKRMRYFILDVDKKWWICIDNFCTTWFKQSKKTVHRFKFFNNLWNCLLLWLELRENVYWTLSIVLIVKFIFIKFYCQWYWKYLLASSRICPSRHLTKWLFLKMILITILLYSF